MKNILALITLVATICLPAVAATSKKPNVIIIYADDMGYADIGTYGGEKMQTPNIDELADKGLKFTNFYAASNICSPSRASLLTGLYPPKAGMPKVLLLSDNGLSNGVTTMAEMLAENDYQTALVGKWHLGHHTEFLPTRHGFQYFYGTPFSHDIYINGELPFYENEKVIEWSPDNSQLTIRYTEKSLEFIRKNKNRPFFLYLAHNMPHTPLAVSSKFEGKSKAGLYGDVMMEFDWSVGQIVKELKKLGIDDNTLLIISSDNGPDLKKGIHSGSAGPFREGKGTTFEGGHRVPGIFYMPGQVLAGKENNDLVSQLDIFPTVAAITGSNLPSYNLDGQSLWTTLTAGKSHTREDIYYFQQKEIEAYRRGDLKYHRAHKYRHPIKDEKKKGAIRLKVERSKLEASVFNVEKDKGETTNIIAQQEQVKNAFEVQMIKFAKEVKKTKFSPEIKAKKKNKNK